MYNEKFISIIEELSNPLEPIPTGELPEWAESRRISSQTSDSRFSAVIFDVYGTLFVSGSGDIGVTEDIQSSEILGKLVLDAVYKLKETESSAAGYDLSLSGRVGMLAKKVLFKVIKDTHAELKSSGIKYPEVDIRTVWRDVIVELAASGIEGFPREIGDMKRTANINSIIDELAVRYECSVNPVWPMPGSVDLIGFLRDKKVEMGIISNAQFYTPLIFKALMGSLPEKLGFNSKLLFYSYLFGKAKPSTAMFKFAAEMLENSFNIPVGSVLYVGNDILNDIKPAKDGGFKTALFAGDERSLRLREDYPECRNILPEYVITNLKEIAQLF